MPEWFTSLAIFTLTVLMVAFLASVLMCAVGVIYTVVKALMDTHSWKKRG